VQKAYDLASLKFMAVKVRKLAGSCSLFLLKLLCWRCWGVEVQ
jgi:hypothetical protein